MKNVTGDISPAWFMTDIAPQFYDVFCAVFNCEPIQLYCTWHVDKALKEQLKSKIKNFAIEVEVYKQLTKKQKVIRQLFKYSLRKSS